MKKIITVLFFAFSSNAAAQINLVPNPSFEDTVSCPHFANQIDRAAGWQASRNSPDYFNECDWLTGNTAVPQNFCGYQDAFEGNAYSGFIAYYRPVSNQREYFTCQLNTNLTIGKKYLVSFFVSLSGEGGRNIPCNKIGILLSTLDYNLTAPAPLGNYCQFYTDSIIDDTLNWTLIEGFFVADSAYSFLTIGNFFDDFQTDTTYQTPGSMSYYYIDLINLFEDTTTSIEETGDEPIDVFPNPVANKLTICSKGREIIKVEVYGNLGQLIRQNFYSLRQKKVLLDLSELPAGIYTLKIYMEKQLTTYYKLLKI